MKIKFEYSYRLRMEEYMIRRTGVRKAMAVAAILVMTTGAVGCGAKKAEQTSASTEVTSQDIIQTTVWRNV